MITCRNEDCGNQFDPFEESGDTSFSCPECNTEHDPGDIADIIYDQKCDDAYDRWKDETGPFF